MTRFGFVIRHGWSFDGESLQQLATELRRFTPFILLDDLGYWKDNETLHRRRPDIEWIAVGHSFGFMSLLQETQHPWRAAIGIGAFHEFPADGLAAMQQSFRRQPLGTVKAFRRRCDLLQPLSIPSHHATGHVRMIADLGKLQHTTIPQPPCPVLYLHGANDRIVPPLEESIVHEAHGHNLGIDAGDWCAARIESFLFSHKGAIDREPPHH